MNAVTRTHNRLARVVLVLATLGYVAWSLYAAVVGIGMAVYRCEDRCLSFTAVWTSRSSAWQWYAIGLLAAISLLAALATVILRSRGMASAAFATLGVQAGCILAAAGIRRSGGDWDPSLAHVLAFVIGEGGGLAAIALSRRRPATSRREDPLTRNS
jgi:hypothetical protein